MNVLSLFDGISCGQLALNKATVPYAQYFASEIDQHAIKVTQHNYPNTIQLGSVLNVHASNLPQIDLLIGGSPCQGFSFSGKQLNFNDPRSALFFEYVRILNECKPTYFLLENVVMKKEYEQVITDYLNVKPIMINSALVSAQTRKRLYWTNIPNVTQPYDKHITWKDVREHDDIANTYTCVNKTKKTTILKLSNDQAVASMRGRFLINGKRVDGKMKTAGLTKQYIEFRYDGKSNCLTTVQKDNVVVPHTLTERILADDFYYRYMSPVECERLQTVPDNYTDCVSKTNRIKHLGNGWTVDVIAHIFKNLTQGTT